MVRNSNGSLVVPKSKRVSQSIDRRVSKSMVIVEKKSKRTLGVCQYNAQV